VDPLAFLDDVQARFPVAAADEDRVETLLQDASAVVRSYTKQDFTLTDTVARIRPIGGRLILPQRPVTGVTSVKVFDYNENLVTIVGWMWDGGQEVWLMVGETVINLAEGIRDLFRFNTPLCQVDYTHGYDVIPDDIVTVVCGMVIRSLATPGYGSIQSQSAGPFSQRLSDAAIQGIVALTPSDRDILNSYRPGSRTVELR
jgi:hypothetical protein